MIEYFNNNIDINKCFDVANIFFKDIDIDIVEAVKLYLYIMKYLNNLIDIMIPKQPKVEKKKSLFEEYDRENGYLDKEEVTLDDIKKMLKTNMDYYIKYSITALNNSYVESINTDLKELLKFIKFNMKYEKENEKEKV